jgi:2-keto-4-pentenoate hydratase
MDEADTDRAAKLLADVHRTGERLARLPEGLRPRDADEAYGIECATVARLGDTVGGWKVALTPDFGVLAGILLGSRVFTNGAALPAVQAPMLGVEAEIAFRFDRALPARERDYDRGEIDAAVTAFAAIEIVDTRYRDYAGTPTIERAADFMSNGGFISGDPRPDWRAIDLAGLEARLLVDGVEIVRQVGGHATKDPLIPAIALANYLRPRGGIAAGQIATTGTYTGLNFAKPGSTVRAIFTGFGSAEMRFTP